MPGRGGKFELVEHAGTEDGPTVALLGGIHGDEDEGVLAVQRVSAALAEHPLRRGSLRAVAVAHPAAYAANRRTSPLDGLNLARCFPGRPDGSATERLAHELTERVIRGSDVLVDLHSAGRAYAMPSLAGYVTGEGPVAARSRRVAVAFGAPLIWEHPGPVTPGRTISTALELGVACIYVEGSGGGSIEARELDLYAGGVLRVLDDLGMLSGPPPAAAEPRLLVSGGGDLDEGLTAPCSGRFVAATAAGDALDAGGRIGEIVDETGATAAELIAPADCTVMFLRRATRIDAGEVVCALGRRAVPWRGR